MRATADSAADGCRRRVADLSRWLRIYPWEQLKSNKIWFGQTSHQNRGFDSCGIIRPSAPIRDPRHMPQGI